MKLPFLSSSFAGLSIERDGMRLIQLKRNKDNFTVEYRGEFPLPERIFTEGNQISDWQAFAESLTVLPQALGKRASEVALLLQADWVKTKRLSLPFGMSKKAMLYEIEREIRSDLPKETGSLCIDFVTLLELKQTAYIDVFAVAADKKYIKQYVHCVHQAGLRVKRVTLDVYALQCILQFQIGQKHQDNIRAVLYLKAKMAKLAVFNGAEIVFHLSFDAVPLPDILTQLKKTMQICGKKFGFIKTHTFILLSGDPLAASLLSDIEQWWWGGIHCINSFAKIPGLEGCSLDFVMALGLALSHCNEYH